MSIFSSDPGAPFRTLVEALCAAPPDKPFVTMWRCEDDIDSITFGEFRRRAAIQAAGMLRHGARPGDTVVLIMQQGIPLMTAFSGAMMLGAIPAILAYPNFKVEPAKYRAGLIGVTGNLKARLTVVNEDLPDELMSYLDAGGGGARVIRGINIPDRDAEEAPVLASSDPQKVAFIQHSAGTTGLQKGVALSHSAVLRQLGHLADALKLVDGDSIYSWLPLYHDMGLIACFMLPLAYHLPVVMQAPDDWVLQPATMLELITQYRCTLTWVPNFTLQFLARRVRAEDWESFDLSSLRAIINCSEPLRAQSLDEFEVAYRRHGLKLEALQSSYAMAENVFAVTQSDLSTTGPRRLWVDAGRFRDEHVAMPVAAHSDGSVCCVSSGKCLPGNEVRIVSADGQDLPPGAVGEILIRSDSMFEGYYNRPEATAAVLREGWYRSGDLGFVWEDEVYVAGRKKDLIIVAGKNIHPHDVEEIVSRHPDIHDGRVVVLGLYNTELGTEDIVAVAELHDDAGGINAMAIERVVRGAVVAELGVALRKLYLKPPRWLVKSTAGKPARTATRDKLLAEHPELNHA